MSYITKSLSADEEVKLIAPLHWAAYLQTVPWFLLGLLTFGLTWIVCIIQFISLKCWEQGATNKRVIVKRGIISRHTNEMKASSVETVEMTQGLIGRIFNMGNIKVTGRGTSDVVLKHVADPIKVKIALENLL